MQQHTNSQGIQVFKSKLTDTDLSLCIDHNNLLKKYFGNNAEIWLNLDQFLFLNPLASPKYIQYVRYVGLAQECIESFIETETFSRITLKFHVQNTSPNELFIQHNINS